MDYVAGLFGQLSISPDQQQMEQEEGKKKRTESSSSGCKNGGGYKKYKKWAGRGFASGSACPIF